MANKLYQVQTGETLKSIAKDHLGDEPRWQEIAYINSLTQPYFISPGQLILLPDDDQPLELVVSAPIATADRNSAVSPEANFKLSPAELGLLVGGVVFLWWILSR